MDRVEDFFALVLDLEGGYTNNPHDRGKGTKYGVTQGIYNSYNATHNIARKDIQLITVSESKSIYYNYYYEHVPFISNSEFHFNHIDVFYNCGTVPYANFRMAMHGVSEPSKIYAWRLSYYKELNQSHMIDGWMNRIKKIQKHFLPKVS